MQSQWMNISESLRITCKICTWNSMSIIFKGFGHKLPIFVFQLQNCMTSDNLRKISVPSFVYMYNIDKKEPPYGIINAVYRYSSFSSSWHTAGLCVTSHLKLGSPCDMLWLKNCKQKQPISLCTEVLRANVRFTTFFLSTVMMSDFK